MVYKYKLFMNAERSNRPWTNSKCIRKGIPYLLSVLSRTLWKLKFHVIILVQAARRLYFQQCAGVVLIDLI